MAYKLNKSKIRDKHFRRIAREQVGRALSQLSSSDITAAQVHECRKVVKRIRAMLHLIAPVLSAREFKARYRGIGRAGDILAGARTAAALVDALGKLEARYAGEVQELLAPLRAKFASDQSSAAHSLSESVARTARRRFAKEGARLEKIKFKSEGFDAVAAGLQKTYQTARKNFARAYDNPGDARFHELRKAVQWHWRHMALLSGAWPEYLSRRIEACRVLAEQLGDDHDLTVLLNSIDAMGDETKIDRPAIGALVRRRQDELRAQAYSMAARLFAEQPKAFARRIEAYWDCLDTGEQPALVKAADSSPPKASAAAAGNDKIQSPPADVKVLAAPRLAAKSPGKLPSSRPQ